MNAPLRWAFVGASSIADEYMAPALSATECGHGVAIVSGSSERRHRFAERHDLIHKFHDVDDLVRHAADFDAAYVSTTNETHYALAMKIASAGRHVLCEKPLTLAIADADQLVRHCADAGIVLAVNHHLRATRAHRYVRELLTEQVIGTPCLIQVSHTFDLQGPELRWRGRAERGGGVTLDATVHDVDLVRFLLADEITRLSALALDLEVTGGNVEDGVTGWMATDANVRVSFTDAFQQSAAPSELVVHGTAGSLKVANAMEQGGRRVVVVRRRGGPPETVEFEPCDPYAITFAAFHAAVRGQGEPLATGHDGAAALRVADAVRRSAAGNGAIIELATI